MTIFNSYVSLPEGKSHIVKKSHMAPRNLPCWLAVSQLATFHQREIASGYVKIAIEHVHL